MELKPQAELIDLAKQFEALYICPKDEGGNLELEVKKNWARLRDLMQQPQKTV